MPALLSEEIQVAGCPPVRVTLLGEELVAFRDMAGRPGLLGAYCPHRCAPLFYGRNEEGGLRCAYHGWQFNVDGRCIDIPSDLTGRLRERVRCTSYPCVEAGGVIWTYMGGTEPPEFVEYEWIRAPDSHRRISKTGEQCNWLQGAEGALDNAHTSFLHSMRGASAKESLATRNIRPILEVERTSYGLRYAAIRELGSDGKYVRVCAFMLPAQQMRGGLVPGFLTEREGLRVIDGHIWVPIDDENTWVYNWTYSIDKDAPISDEWWERYESAFGRGKGDFVPGTYWLKACAENDFGIDRSAQMAGSMTGIKGVNTQDFAIQVGMGPIVDRSKEYPGITDRAIMLYRKILLEKVDDVIRDGVKPMYCMDGSMWRGADAIIDQSADWREEMNDIMMATSW